MSLDESLYRVELEGDQARIVDSSGTVIAECGSERNAQHYLVLLSKAYRRGFKDGYRAGKESTKD